MDRNRTALIMQRSQILWYGLLLVPIAFLAVFFFYPLGTIFMRSFRPDGIWNLSGFVRIATSPYYRETIIFTVWQAFLSTIITMALALPAAFIFTRYRFPFKSLLMSLSTLPFVLPTVVVATAFQALIGQRGIVNDLLVTFFQLDTAPIQLQGTLTLILIAHVFYNYTIALRMITGYWINQSTRIEEAAQVLGASGWRLWWDIRLPVLRPILLASAALIFIFTFTSFGVVLILGGIQFATLEVQIYYQARSIGNLSLAAALSLVQIGAMFAMMLIYTRLQSNISGGVQQQSQVAITPQTWRAKAMISINIVLMVILLFTPLIALIARSVNVDGNFGLDYYFALTENTRNSVLFVPPLEAVRNSLQFASLTTVVAVILGLITAYLLAGRGVPKVIARWLDPIFMLPLATSAVTLGFGFIIALDEPPLDLRSSWLIIPIAHTLVAIPFVVRSILPAIRGVPQNVRDAAAILGASSWQRWLRIELPLISRGLIVGATFAFTVSMGEFGASLFVARPNLPTMPLVIFRLLGQPGATNYGQAIAMSTLLMLVTAVSFIAIERIRTTGIGEF